MFIKQISVFLENTLGSLREMTSLLGHNNIDMMALSIADTQNFGIVRIIVSSSQVDPALTALRTAGFTARVNNVVCIVVEDKPMGLCRLLETIEDTGLSVEYIYSFFRSTGDNALIVVRLSDQSEAVVSRLGAQGLTLFTQEQIDTL